MRLLDLSMEISVDPYKIVAGLEPIKTNEFLYQLYLVVIKDISPRSQINSVLKDLEFLTPNFFDVLTICTQSTT